MQNVQFINRGPDPLAEALSSIIGQRQQQQQFDQQTTRSQQSQQDARDWQLKMAALQAYQTITDPATKAAAYTKLAPEIQAQIPDPSSLPTPEPTAEEQASVAASRADRDAMAKGNPDPIEGASMNAPADSRIASAGASLPVSRESSTGIGSDIGGGDTAPQVEAPTVSDRLNARIAQFRQGAKGAAPPKELIGTWVTDLTHGDAGLAAANDVERKLALTAEEQTKVPFTQAQTGEANAKAFESRAVGQKNLAEIPKLSAETEKLKREGANAEVIGQSLARDIVANPRSYFSLPTEDKKLAIKALKGRVPVNLNSQELKVADSADAGLALLDDVKSIEDKWAARGVRLTGPMLGRYNVAEQKWGGEVLPSLRDEATSNELLGDIAKIREWLTVGPVQEAAALVGSRPPWQLMAKLESTYPAMYQNQPIFEGALSGVRQRLEERRAYYDKKAWGPNGPPSMPGAAPSTSPKIGSAAQSPGEAWAAAHGAGGQ